MPTTLTVADFLSLRMQYKAEQAENEIPAVIEHNFKDGRMVDHYFVVPDDFDGIVYDVGGGMFDHHQEPRETRPNGVPYAAFGLLFGFGGGLGRGNQAAHLAGGLFQQVGANRLCFIYQQHTVGVCCAI